MDFSQEELEGLQGLRSQFTASDMDGLNALRSELAGPSTASKVASDIGTGIKEAPAQALRGAEQAVNETSQAAYGVADWLNDHVMDLGSVEFGKASSNGWVSWHRGMPHDGNTVKVPDAVIPGEAKSVTGGLVSGVSQFTTGMLLAGRYLKAAGVGEAATVAGKVGQGLVKGAIADATVFDPHAERMSNLVQQYPALQNPVSEFLAAKDDDGEALGRFKNAAEGLGLGAAAETLGLGLKALKLSKTGKPQEAAEVLEEIAAKAPEPEHPIKHVEPDVAPEPAKAPEAEAKAPEAEAKAPEPEEPVQAGGGEAEPPHEAPQAGAEAPKDDAGIATTPADAPAPKRLIEMDAEGLRKSIDERIKEDAYGQGRVIGGIRTDLIQNGDDINSIMSGLRTVYREQFDKAVGGEKGVRTWEQVRANVDRLADTVGDDPRMLMQRMAAMQGNLHHLDAETRLYEDFLTTVGDKLYKLSDMVSDPQGGHGTYADRTALMQDFAKHYELMANVQGMYKGIQTNIARSLGSMKMGGKINARLAAGDLGSVFEQGPRRMEELARQISATGGSTKRMVQATKGGLVAKFLNSVNEYWINSVLSGPKTHVVNIASSIATSAFMPAERMIAGAIRGGTQAGRQEVLEGALQYVGLVSSMREAVTLAGRSFKKGEAILDAGSTAFDTAPYVSAARWNVTNPVGSLVMNGLGNVTRLPSRFLTSEDEFMKQLNYRAAVRASAWREGYEQGLWRDPKKMAALVAQRLDEAVDATSGAATNPAALERARSVTFTNALQTQTHGDLPSIGEMFQKLGNDHPGARLIVPFVRAPTNIMRFVYNRTPGINLMRKQVQNDLMGRNGP